VVVERVEPRDRRLERLGNCLRARSRKGNGTEAAGIAGAHGGRHTAGCEKSEAEKEGRPSASGITSTHGSVLSHLSSVIESRRYLARRYVTLALPPIDGVGLKYVTSSPSNERMRVCVPLAKLGNVLPSTLTVSTWVASSIEYVPK